jgi:GH25 family lysozyme M1 (1,4-beta-N-acetylmuramidase)
MTSTETLREQAVEVANGLVGLGAATGDPQKDLQYRGLVAPGETLGTQNDMATMSGCALVAAGVWRAVGVGDETLNAPYVIGQAISRLYNLAVARGAWVDYSASKRPSPGDTVLLTNAEHVYTVIEISADGNSLTTVDGGQVDAAYNQIILKKTRTWSGSTDVCGSTSRTISGWVDITRLGAAQAPSMSFFQNAPDNVSGLVSRTSISADSARSCVASGYQLCLRSLPGADGSDGLGFDETATLLAAGLALTAFAPRPSAGWDPCARDAVADATQAAEAARSAGLSVGTGVWLELADVAAGASSSGVAAYCNTWCDQVARYGFLPGVAVGQSPCLDGNQLHTSLTATRYIRLSSAAPDVATRGYQIDLAPGSTTDLICKQDGSHDRAPWVVVNPIVAGAATTTATTPSNASTTDWPLGTDVYSGMGTIDWRASASFGVTFAFIKATEGTTDTDPAFAQNWQNARVAGVLRGAYHYFTHRTTPLDQANHFVDVMGTDFDLPPALDLEETAGIPSKTDLEANVRTFLDRVEELTGVRPIIYTYPSFWMSYMPASTWAADYDLWLADYNTTPLVPSPWTRWKFWQFRGDTAVSQVSKKVDLDWFAGSISDLQAYCISAGSAGPAATAPPVPPPPGEVPTTIEVTASSLSVRLGSSSTATKIGEAPSGTRLSVVERTTDSSGNEWYGVELWVAGVYGGSTYVKPA